MVTADGHAADRSQLPAHVRRVVTICRSGRAEPTFCDRSWVLQGELDDARIAVRSRPPAGRPGAAMPPAHAAEFLVVSCQVVDGADQITASVLEETVLEVVNGRSS
ncbi:hypothetical protein [Curtobacterium sp. APC 4022]|uniref:hypothetical protein n=1 Tax=Curtobacterium sp. APC 4022 TaxID=3035201 RepID=UPI0025B4C3C9|nr:hypothetical protein [Curtobacterium sp. APC 4022]MDN3479760.1 hypothetical protein [Curtobacterium sp. APC 4022]